ncbi:MAG: hypothetical protein CMJ84_15030 [Planctomycetes bacterium]|jgi:hypothetical protein|nr:hypothetical protein [Planctomycetota bacterium]MDP6410213.1 DUF3570 domain-containing protein [Planctomycetota bacterium]
MLLIPRALAGLAPACLAAAAPALAQEMAQGTAEEEPEIGSRSLRVQLGTYVHDDSGDGNPFLDEDLVVIEPAVIFDHQLSESFGYSVDFSYDFISAASIDRLGSFPEQSGASRDNYIGADVAFRHRTSEETLFGWHVGLSHEYDYNSLRLGGDVTLDRSHGQILNLGLNAYYDVVDIIRFDGSEDEGSDERLSGSATAKWYRPLSSKMHAELGLTLAHQSGFLETPYNAVVIEDPDLPPNPNLDNEARGFEITEELPDSRSRGVLFGRARRWIGPRTALELGGRLYVDDWGIESVTVEPRLYRTLVADELDLRLRYRFYTQSAADFFSESFIEEVPLRTQDSDLADFDSHTFGTRLTWQRSATSSIDLDLNYTLRSDGLDHIYTLLGWSWNF